MTRQSLPIAAPTLLLFLLLFVHVTALRSITLAITVAVAILVWRRNPGPPVPLKLPLALWAGMALLSLAWARDPGYSLSEIRVEVGYDIVYFLSFFALTRERRDWNVFRGTLLAGLATIAVLAVWLYARTHDLDTDSFLGGIVSISTHLVTIFPLLVAAMIEFRRNYPALAATLIVAAAALGVGYFTFNRNFILAIDAIALTMAVMLVRHRAAGRQRLAIVAFAVAIVISSGLFFRSVVQHRAGDVDTTVQSALQSDPRLSIWQFSLELIREHPFTGVGFGRFAAADSYREKYPHERANAHAHNPFLNYAVQMGIGGVAVLLLLLFSLAREFWVLWKSDLLQIRLIGAAGMAMLVGVIVKTQTSDLWGRQHGYLFWALTGMMLGYAHRLRRNQY